MTIEKYKIIHIEDNAKGEQKNEQGINIRFKNKNKSSQFMIVMATFYARYDFFLIYKQRQFYCREEKKKEYA